MPLKTHFPRVTVTQPTQFNVGLSSDTDHHQPDWTEVDVVDRITQIVARVSSRMFGGTALSRNKEWVQSSIDFATDGFIGAQALKKYPEWFKPIAARFIPAIQNIKKHYENAEKAAIPLLEERARTGATASDLLYWMGENAKGSEQDRAFLAGILLKVSFAAIHTSAAAPSQLLYDLCAMPEYIEPLRQEIAANTGPDGIISRQGFQNLSKLDSIMKESQRFNPLLLSKSHFIDGHIYGIINQCQSHSKGWLRRITPYQTAW